MLILYGQVFSYLIMNSGATIFELICVNRIEMKTDLNGASLRAEASKIGTVPGPIGGLSRFCELKRQQLQKA